MGGFFGPPEKVAAALADLAEAGITRIQLSPFSDASLDAARSAPVRSRDAVSLDDVDPFSPAFQQNPFPYYEAMREIVTRRSASRAQTCTS